MVEFIDNYWQSNPEEEYQKFLSLLGLEYPKLPQITKKYKISNNKIISRTDISGIIIKGIIDKNSINKERRLFSGFGSVQIVDRQGDYLPIHEFKPVMEKLMARGAPVTDSHSNHVVGKIVDYTYKPTESGELGLYLTAEIYNHYPSDEETWHKIQDGEYTGFSLGGKAGTKTPTCTNIGCYNILGDIEAWEFSIVERPANQLANIDKVNKLAKASDVVDEVISSIIRKERIYIKSPYEAPKGVKIETGERGGLYYESEGVSQEKETKPQDSQTDNQRFTDVENWEKSLTKEQKNAIHWWMHDGYSQLRNADKNNKIDNDLKNLKEALNTAPKYRGEVHRGIRADINANVGDTISLNAISSFSTNRAIAREFAIKVGGARDFIPKNVKFTILSVDKSKSNLKLPIKPIGGTFETETIFLKGTSFKIISIEPHEIKRLDGRRWKGKILHLEEI